MLFLGGAFRLAETHSPPVALDNECPAFEGNTCTDCIRQVPCDLSLHLALLLHCDLPAASCHDVREALTSCPGKSKGHET